MKLKLTFTENKADFNATFGELNNLSDGGYERGYAEGYNVGNTEGYNKGHTEGVKQGFADGYEEGASQYGAIMRGMLDATLTEFRDDKLTKLRRGAFIYNPTLEIIEAPNLKTMEANVFTQCGALQRASFPNLTSIGNDAFSYCSNMTYCDIGNTAFIGSWVFTSCTKLQALIIRKSDGICELKQINSIDGNAIAKGTGFVYVPDDLVNSYKTAKNWSTYASQIKPLSELEE